MTEDNAFAIADRMLLQEAGGCFVQAVASEDQDRFSLDVRNRCKHRFVRLSGKSCVRRDKLFCALADALKFPDYFGHNWDALEECLRDREFTPRVDTVLVVYDSEHVLIKDTQREQQILVDILRETSKGLSVSNYQHMNLPYPALWLLFLYDDRTRSGFGKLLQAKGEDFVRVLK